MDQKKDFKYHQWKLGLYAFSISLGGFLFGFGLTQSLSILFYFHFKNSTQYIYQLYQIMPSFGAILGCLLGYYITFLAATGYYAFACFLSFLPVPNFVYHLVTKAMVGAGVGYLSFVCPLFIYEIAPIYSRGWMMGLMQLSITFGEFYVALIEVVVKENYNLKKTADGEIIANLMVHKTSIIAFISSMVYLGPVLVALTILFLFWKIYPYETPQYELRQENYAQVKKIFAIYYKKESLKNRIEQFVADQRKIPNQSGTVTECWQQNRCRAFVVSSTVAALQQLSGINAIMIHLVQVGSQWSENQSLYFILGVGMSCISIIFFVTLFHKLSRKLLLVGGFLLMASAEGSVICFLMDREEHTTFIMLLTCFFIVIFEITIGPIGWIQIHQILQPRMAALASSMNWIFSLVVTITISMTQLQRNDDKQDLSELTIVFGVFCVCGSIILIMCYPETNYKTKYQIQELIQQGRNTSSFKNTLLTGFQLSNSSEHV